MSIYESDIEEIEARIEGLEAELAELPRWMKAERADIAELIEMLDGDLVAIERAIN